MKTIVRPSAWAFFNGWPTLGFPLLDGGFVTFQCPTGRPLHAPVQLAENLPDMPGMIGDLELIRNQVRDAVAGPQGRLIAQSLGTFSQQLHQPLLVRRTQ